MRHHLCVRQMLLYWGVKPYEAVRAESTDELIESSLELLKKNGIIEKDDVVVITAGSTHETKNIKYNNHTNIMRVITVR